MNGISRGLKVKSNSAVGLPVYDFLLVLNSYIWPIPVPLLKISL